jgi:hypothetical protein
MRDKLIQSWGRFEEAIFTDFRLTYPLEILTGPSDDRASALPIIRFSIKQDGRWEFVLTAECQCGPINCRMVPTGKKTSGIPILRGALELDGAKLGCVNVGEGRSSLLEFKSIADSDALQLSLERAGPGPESDVVMIAPSFGMVAKITRNVTEWKEQWQSRVGLGRLKRGGFCGTVDGALLPVELKTAIPCLLSLYFQITEITMNTDLGGS